MKAILSRQRMQSLSSKSPFRLLSSTSEALVEVKRKMGKQMARREIVADQRARNVALEGNATQSSLPWRIMGATYVFTNIYSP